MATGPIEYIIVGFPDNDFNGEIVPELARLIESGTIRILDLIFIGKDTDGSVAAFEFDEVDGLIGYADLDGSVGGLIGPDDVAHVGDLLEPGSSAALLIWEDLWAAPFADAVRASGGLLLQGARIPHELIEPALSSLPDAV